MDLRERPTAGFERHPWELARYRFFRGVLARAGLDRAPLSLLDVGAGDAWFSAQLVPSLPEGSTSTCWDIHYDEASAPPAFADPRLVPTRERPERQFELTLLLDVAEHVEDDRAFLREIVARSVTPGGAVLFSVPAFAALTTAHDLALGHYRRYSPREARALLVSAGLEIVQAGGLFHSLVAARAASVARERLLGRPEHPVAESLEWRAGPLLGGLVGAALALDGAVSRAGAALGLDLPGLSFWALCRRKEPLR
jgi:hypothetical protein